MRGLMQRSNPGATESVFGSLPNPGANESVIFIVIIVNIAYFKSLYQRFK